MKNEEKYMNEGLLRENPFRVPEGYFDNLTDRVMSQLPNVVRRAGCYHYVPGIMQQLL